MLFRSYHGYVMLQAALGPTTPPSVEFAVVADWWDVVRVPTEEIVPPIGECRRRAQSPLTTIWNNLDGASLDAGPALTLLTPVGPLEVRSFAPNGYSIYGGMTTTDGAFAPRARYELIGSGGTGVPPFVGDFNAPSDLVMISPLERDFLMVPQIGRASCRERV